VRVAERLLAPRPAGRSRSAASGRDGIRRRRCCPPGAAPRATARCSRTGRHAFKWLDTPHVPHGWECGFMMELETRTLALAAPLHPGRLGRRGAHEGDILGRARPSVVDGLLRATPAQTGATLERLAASKPQVLACMHGSAWRGDGGLAPARPRPLLARPRCYAGAGVD